MTINKFKNAWISSDTGLTGAVSLINEGKTTLKDDLTIEKNIITNNTTITPIELSYVDGCTSNIQTQINSCVGLANNNTFTGINILNLIQTPTISWISNTSIPNTTMITSQITPINTSITTINTSITAIKLLSFLSQASTSLSFGLNASQYQSTSIGAGNLAIGNYSMQGFITTPALNTSQFNTCIGHYSGQLLYNYTGLNTNSNYNTVVGNSALRNSKFVSVNNTILGYNCCKTPYTANNNVLIGANICSLGNNTINNSVIIGANSCTQLTLANSHSGMCMIGYNNMPSFNGNGCVVLGTSNGQSTVDNNSGIIIGNNSGSYCNANFSAGLFFGHSSGNNCGDGYNVIIIGNGSDSDFMDVHNSTAIGHSTLITDHNQLILGGVNGYDQQRVNLPTKNYIKCVQNSNLIDNIHYILFASEEYVVISDNITIVSLPECLELGNFNIGASFTIVRNYQTTPNISIVGAQDQLILDSLGGVPSLNIIMGEGEYFITLICVNNLVIGNNWIVKSRQGVSYNHLGSLYTNTYYLQSDYLTIVNAQTEYLTQANAILNYQPIGNYLSTTTAAFTYLSKTSATALYQPIGSYVNNIAGYIQGVYPSTVAASLVISNTAIYSSYLVNSTAMNITIPPPTAAQLGCIIQFRKTGNIAAVITLLATTGLPTQYVWALNSITNLTTVPLMAANIGSVRIQCVASNCWAII